MNDTLKKVTLNLFEADVEWYKKRYGYGWSEVLRLHIHKITTDRAKLEDELNGE